MAVSLAEYRWKRTVQAWTTLPSAGGKNPAVTPVHVAVRGRARFKVSGLYHNSSYKRELETYLSRREEILSAEASDLTGNVLVLFRVDRTPASIAVLLAGYVKEHPPGNGFDPPEGQTNADRFSSGHKTPQGNVGRRKLRKLIGGVKRQPDKPWHLMDPEDVMAFFGATFNQGLSSSLVKSNLTLYGPNVLPESVPRSGWRIFFGQLRSLPVYMLGCSAVVSLLTGGVADAVVILAVVGINAAIGYVTESQAEMTIHSLKRLVQPSALIIREGDTREIHAEEVVPGDLLVFRPGSYIAADCRIIDAQQMTVDESALTGESLPVIKTVKTLSGKEVLLADRVNMGFMGTLVTGGQGMGVVVRTGRFTELGEVHSLVEAAESPKTPMERELDRIGNQLVLISSAICGGVFLVGLLRGYGTLQMFKSAITLGVAAIPEGLPAVATTVLALGIRKMKQHHVLIRRLDAVETLGCLQTVCLDKTGTITLNRMTVVELQAGLKRITVSEGKIWGEQGPVTCREAPELGPLLRIGALCSETEIARKEGGYVLHGSSTENALVEFALAQEIDVVRLRQQYPLRRMTHRTESRPHMSTLHEAIPTENPDSDFLADKWSEEPGRLVAVKGSPSEVLQMCTWQMRDGRREPLGDPGRQAIELENERMAGNGLRVLGLAFCRIGAEIFEGPADHGLVWLGLIGMADPIRDGLKDLIEQFHRAHIDTVMITGDQVPTAYAIGRELGLQRDGQLEIFESTRLREIDPEVLAILAKRAQIFARVSPAQKLQIVRAFQRAGKVVAMTGDGINDGPALKAADIGVAMGEGGTDVAREVANVVLEDDNLETLVVAIGHGRSIYGNIRKSIRFLLSTNMSEIMVMLAAITAGLGQPLTPIQLLWINLLSDIFPGLALSLEEPEPDVLERPPRNPQDPIISKDDFRRLAFESTSISAGAMTAYGYGIARYGMGARAGTLAFTSLTVGQLLHTLSCRSERVSMFSPEKLPPNPYIHLALGGSLLLQAAAMLVPGLRGLLGVTPIGLLDGTVIGGSAVLPLLVNEASKKPKSVRSEA